MSYTYLLADGRTASMGFVRLWINLFQEEPPPGAVETLMGWPIGWTDSKPLETDRYQQWLHSHGDFYQGPTND